MKPSCILLHGFFTTEITETTEKLELETLDAIGEPSDIEIDQKSRLDLCELHICKQLSLVNAFDFIDYLQFRYQLIINQNIYPGLNSCGSIRPLFPGSDPDFTGLSPFRAPKLVGTRY
jgi:hypothetical protein